MQKFRKRKGEIKLNEIKETQEQKYSQEDILNALLALDEEQRSSLMRTDYLKLAEMANNLQYLREVYQTFEWYIGMYQSLKNATLAFVSELQRQKAKGVEHTIDTMMEHYKGFSREERLEFNKKLLDATSIESSMDNFKYTWGKFLETFLGSTN